MSLTFSSGGAAVYQKAAIHTLSRAPSSGKEHNK